MIKTTMVLGTIIASTIINRFPNFSQINLNDIAAISQIVIAIGAIASMSFALKALKKTDWSLAMSTAPSIAIMPRQISVWTMRDEHIAAGNDYNKIITDPQLNGDTLLKVGVLFDCKNLGRGPAFNVRHPKIIGGLKLDEHTQTPPYLSTPEKTSDTTEKTFAFSAYITKTFDEWLKDVDTKIPIKVELGYTNDQKNIKCVSWWSAEIKPFDDENSQIKVRSLNSMAFSMNGGVNYNHIS